MHQDITAKNPALQSMLEAIPSAAFIVSEKLEILDYNTAAKKMIGADAETVLMKLCGEALSCLHEQGPDLRCGTTPACPECPIRFAIEQAYKGFSTVRAKHKFLVRKNGATQQLYINISSSPITCTDRILAVLVLEDITELETLREIIPICSHCKSIRNDTRYWESVESYFKKHAGARFSHSICPECIKKHYNDLDIDDA